MLIAVLLTVLLQVVPVAAEEPSCSCADFATDVADVERAFKARNDRIALPLTVQHHAQFRARVDQTYARARCLADCASVPEKERNLARALLAVSAFKSQEIGHTAEEVRGRLTAAAETAERCLAVEPEHRGCMLWAAGARGLLVKGTWNPLQIRLPGELLERFRAARAGLPPGADVYDGAATRAEAALLMRAPGIAGGDLGEARRLMERYTRSPRFPCRVANRLLLAEARARSGDTAGALAALRAAEKLGLPGCGADRYENALSLEEIARCRARLEQDPTSDPGWDDACE